MSPHEQFADDLSLYALGTLEGEERANLEKHLETCPSCRLELDQLRGDMALMATSVTGPKPPQRSRQRLLDAIAKEPRGTAASERKRPWNPWGALGWIAAGILLLAFLKTRHENSLLQQSVSTLASLVGQQTTELAKAQRVVDTLTAPETQKWVLAAAKTPPQPQGKAFYLRDKTGLVFVASNLAPLPADKIYELWLFPKTGGAPMAAGLFKPDPHGSATVVNPPLPAGVEAAKFAVTLEPESGSHEAPRGSVVMASAGE